MKKFFTLIAAVAMAASVNAQTQEWNFSKWNAATFNETTTQDGLTVYAGKDSKENLVLLPLMPTTKLLMA